ncbi:MAG: response regulator [Elusimicrobia bacterium]|nr:response regulator [Elusimicrobiota bacterium]
MAQKIMVVEDEQDLRELIVKSLESAGYVTVACDNGRQVLPLLREEKPDLLLLDIMLPGVDGLQLAKQMGEDAKLSHVPTLAVSALEHSRKQLETLPQMCGFISKPFSMSALLGRIRTVLGRR